MMQAFLIFALQLHNDALKKQVTTLHEEITDFKHELSEKDQLVEYTESQLQTSVAELENLQHRASDAEVTMSKVCVLAILTLVLDIASF